MARVLAMFHNPAQNSTTMCYCLTAEKSAWLRCPSSGKVACGIPCHLGEGRRSFEREALKQWLDAKPGVHPLSKQPLPPGASSGMLPNHAMRNMIQQLSPS